jgi:hypothetical protein
MFRQCLGEHHTSRAWEHVLAAVEFISDGRALHALARPCVPEGLAVAGAEGHHAAMRVAREDEAGIRGEMP